VKIASVESDGIEIIGLDMMHGTPVLDVKPYLHYDVIPSQLTDTYWGSRCNSSDQLELPFPGTREVLVTPNWIVEREVPDRKVKFAETARDRLDNMIGEKLVSFCTSVDDATTLITQVLQQDIRSVHQGRGTHGSSTIYRCHIDTMCIEFVTGEEEILVQNVLYHEGKGSEENIIQFQQF